MLYDFVFWAASILHCCRRVSRLVFFFFFSLLCACVVNVISSSFRAAEQMYQNSSICSRQSNCVWDLFFWIKLSMCSVVLLIHLVCVCVCAQKSKRHMCGFIYIHCSAVWTIFCLLVEKNKLMMVQDGKRRKPYNNFQLHKTNVYSLCMHLSISEEILSYVLNQRYLKSLSKH